MTAEPPEIDTSVPHSARIWNYWLGGKDNYEADRTAGDQFLKAFPDIAVIARATREFMGRAIRYLAIQRKISGTFFKTLAPHYLLLLGIAQTCRFQDKPFLRFLLSGEMDVDAFKAGKRLQVSEAVGPSRDIDL